MVLTSDPCPCHSGSPFGACCRPLLSNKEDAKTPEALMRSRYCAFHFRNIEHLRQTTDPQTIAQMDWDANEKWAQSASFLKLEVLSSSEDGTKGQVEFKAHFTLGSDPKIHIHHEISRFRKQAGHWFYREGKTTPAAP